MEIALAEETLRLVGRLVRLLPDFELAPTCSGK